MKTYIGLLRGINVSGKKKIKMTDLKSLMKKQGFKDVVTYIQSGNMIFKTDEENIHQIELKISKSIGEEYDFEVPVLVKQVSTFKTILQKNPYNDSKELESNVIYFVLLKSLPSTDLVDNLNQESFANEEFIITKNCIYLRCKKGYGNAKCNNNFFERKLKIAATTRNYRTMMKLLELAN